MVLSAWTTPNLKSVTSADYTSLPGDTAFNSDNTDGKFVLFSDSRYARELDSQN